MRLQFGKSECACEVDVDRLVALRPSPEPLEDVAEEVRAAIEHPLDLPALGMALVEGDRVTLVLDRHTPSGATIVAEIWKVLERSGVEAADVTVLQPVAVDPRTLPDPRRELPEGVRNEVVWKVHDPTDEADRSYLASSLAGERIYLARDAADADFVLPIGPIEFDALTGYRGTSSVLYPGLSTTEAISRAHGLGHAELEPDDDRPLRNLMDEVACLMGVQYTVQVIAAGEGGVSHVVAGTLDSVLRRGRELLADQWLVELDERADLVLATLDGPPESLSWNDVGNALRAARNLVVGGGRIVLLTEFAGESSPGLEIVGSVEFPRDAVQPLRESAPPDLMAATELALTADWAHVYLMSGLDETLVENLFMTPVENEPEVQRLVGAAESCIFLGGAQHAWGRVIS